MPKYKEVMRKKKTMSEHRYIVQEFIGRPLRKGEIVHHIDGDKTNNRIENLQIMTPREHAHHHCLKNPIVKKCVECGKKFMPAPSKRKRAKTCSKACFKVRLSRIKRDPSRPTSIYNKDAYPSQVKKRISIVDK